MAVSLVSFQPTTSSASSTSVVTATATAIAVMTSKGPRIHQGVQPHSMMMVATVSTVTVTMAPSMTAADVAPNTVSTTLVLSAQTNIVSFQNGVSAPENNSDHLRRRCLLHGQYKSQQSSQINTLLY